MSRSNRTRIGLALGSGGARGFAHVAVLEAFDELGVKPHVIAGCSMGSVIGAIYAAGMPAKDIRAHAEKLLTNRMGFARYVFGSRQTKVTELLTLGGLMSLHLEGQKLFDLAFPDDLPLTFEESRIPLKIIATDYERMEEVVFTKGSLRQAVAASIAIPGVISAPLIEGRVHVDGGVVNPVPFDHVREDCDIVVAVDVTGKPRPVSNGKVSNMEIAVGSLLIMFQQLAETRRALSPPDIYVRPPVDMFGVGDFFRAKDIMVAANAEKDRLKRAISLRLEADLAEAEINDLNWVSSAGP